MCKKPKITPEVIKNLVQLFNSKDESNIIIAHSILSNLDWNINSKRHKFIFEVFWYEYSKSWKPKGSLCYKFERKCAKILRNMGFKYTCQSSVEKLSNGITIEMYLTRNYKRKFRAFGKKYDPENWQKYYEYI